MISKNHNAKYSSRLAKYSLNLMLENLQNNEYMLEFSSMSLNTKCHLLKKIIINFGIFGLN